ncbi:hypothetical protein [Streptomyces sp. NPDC048277]|uniref:hypothetical protein n=1 Tax=Streptomyces sp. NPDC048277 TaxID=3155027 RepID=UPI00340CFDAE
MDSVFRVRATGDEGGFLIAVESQGQPDPDKLNSWTYYLAHLYAKYRLPPVLLVMCKDKATASWAAEPIRVGHRVHTSMLVFPLVLGPDTLPAITDPEEAADDIPFAVLSALAHAGDPGLPAILEALSTALDGVGDEVAEGWAEYTEVGLGDTPAREFWRQLMAMWTSRFPGSGTLIEETRLKGREEGREEGREAGREEGEARGRAKDILRILALRGVDVPDAVRERITACADLEVLGTWLDRSLTVARAAELFAEG